jgi:CheY-like chemotaxis protein
MNMEKKEVFKQFLETHDVLIVDKNPSSRNRLLKIMSDLGTKRHMIHTSGSLIEAEEIIKTKNVGVVLSDYFIAGGSGFDLFKMIREKNPDKKELTLILVTSNISQTAVAKAAEEDVDSFIIKPYTIQSIQENLISTVASKVRPSEYILKIEEGKSLIADKKYDEALGVLNLAQSLHPKPALALFYIGQAEYLKNHAEEAKGSYNKGLSFNNIHYKCLIGLYEIFMKDSKFEDAYHVVKKVANYFPANPDRLTQIVRLAIQTKNFDDMQAYYEIFTSLDERTPILKNYIGAGMYISGKHCLLNNNYSQAMQYFDNIAVSCSEFPKFIRAMITLLVEHDKAIDAMKFLARFPAGADELDDFLVCDYLVSAHTINDTNYLIKAGLDLYNRKIRDYQCMRVLVESMKKKGYQEKKIAPFKEEIAKLWPERMSV